MAGAVVGVLYGLFGIGSAFATPALALVGVPPLTAVVAPLPAFVPSSAAGAWSYARQGQVDRALAARVAAGAVPAAVVGAALSPHVGGDALLTLQGGVLLVIGARVLAAGRRRAAIGGGEAAVTAGAVRWSGGALVAAAMAVGLLSGLLANGGGFLLVPWFMVVLGLDVHRATGTSLLVATALTVPTLVVHSLLGGVDWHVAGPFALGVVPGAALGGWLAQLVPVGRLRAAFGSLLVGVGLRYLLG